MPLPVYSPHCMNVNAGIDLSYFKLFIQQLGNPGIFKTSRNNNQYISTTYGKENNSHETFKRA